MQPVPENSTTTQAPPIPGVQPQAENPQPPYTITGPATPIIPTPEAQSSQVATPPSPDATTTPPVASAEPAVSPEPGKMPPPPVQFPEPSAQSSPAETAPATSTLTSEPAPAVVDPLAPGNAPLTFGPGSETMPSTSNTTTTPPAINTDLSVQTPSPAPDITVAAAPIATPDTSVPTNNPLPVQVENQNTTAEKPVNPTLVLLEKKLAEEWKDLSLTDLTLAFNSFVLEIRSREKTLDKVTEDGMVEFYLAFMKQKTGMAPETDKEKKWD